MISKINSLKLLLICAIISSCSYTQLKNEAPLLNRIKVNKKFKINLPENHTDGYMWQLKDDYNKNLISHLNAVWHGNEKGIDFNFQSLSIGQVTLSFTKRKYLDTSDFKTFIVNILP